MTTRKANVGNTARKASKRSVQTADQTRRHEEVSKDIVVILCVLQSREKLFRSKKIWRRIAVPGKFSLLELHVSLQNAFDWKDTHLHMFQQPSSFSASVPVYPGFGETDILKAPRLNVDSYSRREVRSFQFVVGIADNFDSDLTPAEDLQEASVYVQHRPLQQLLEERSFIVRDVLSPSSPGLAYEYDYGVMHKVTLLFQGTFNATEGVHYPACLAGQGASRAEDGNDTDDHGNILPSYNYDDFSVLKVLDNFLKTYESSWPVGPDAKPAVSMPLCYMCRRYDWECKSKVTCTGSCCGYCLKSPIALRAGRLNLREADALFNSVLKNMEEKGESVLR